MRSIVFLVTVSLLFSLSSCKDKKKNNIVEPPKREVVVEPVKPVEQVKPAAPVRHFTHFLVAGCFRIKNNADRLCAALESQGYDSQIIPYHDNLYLAVYGGYENKAEAQIALNRMVSEKGKEETWIYPVR